jgi:hypothetical protein
MLTMTSPDITPAIDPEDITPPTDMGRWVQRMRARDLAAAQLAERESDYMRGDYVAALARQADREAGG